MKIGDWLFCTSSKSFLHFRPGCTYRIIGFDSDGNPALLDHQGTIMASCPLNGNKWTFTTN